MKNPPHFLCILTSFTFYGFIFVTANGKGVNVTRSTISLIDGFCKECIEGCTNAPDDGKGMKDGLNLFGKLLVPHGIFHNAEVIHT
jgi:hypothetical protein